MKLNYSIICANLLKKSPQRTIDVIERRFGLKTGERETLEAIGEKYGITRERVRQIENSGLKEIRSGIEKYQSVFQSFGESLSKLGGLKEENSFLRHLAGEKFQNQAYFLLSLDQKLERVSEDDNFRSFWTNDKVAAISAKNIIEKTITGLKAAAKLFNPDELYKNQNNEKLNKGTFFSYLEISKAIQKNPEGMYGLKGWLEINPRGVKDKAYLVLRKEGNPLHFAEVATLIGKLPFPSLRKAQIATVHNELIKDQRFVLVGRGLYGLKEWGYVPGVVKDVICQILKESGKPLAKKEILEKVLKQRFVKANTVSLNLQDKEHFLKDGKGRYTIKEA